MNCSKSYTRQLDVCQEFGTTKKWVDGKGYVNVHYSNYPTILVTASGHRQFCYKYYQNACEKSDCSDRSGQASCNAEEEDPKSLVCYNFIDQCELYIIGSPSQFERYVEVD